MKPVMSSFSFFLPVPELRRKGMPASNKIFLILLVCLLTLIGCLIKSQEPVGETPASINPQDWEGRWVSTDKEVDTRVLEIFNPSQGIFLMKTKVWKTKREEEDIEISFLYLRQSGDWLFASCREVGTTTYFWGGRLENRDVKDRGRVLLLWLPNPEKIVALIKQGLLPGRLDKEKGKEWPVLGSLLPQHYQVMRDHEEELFFEGNKPIVYVRLAKQ